MSERKKVKIGDWIRFRLAGKLVTGVVEYVRIDEHISGDRECITDAGTISEDAVLEIRSAR